MRALATTDGSSPTSNANPEASNAIEVQVQSDGKLVEALTLGDAETAALRRYGPDGQLDATFGTNGTVKLPPQTIDAITIQKDGKILAGGEFGKAFAVTRLNPDGTIDKSFNLDGTQHVSFTTYQAVLKDLLVQPDGKVLIAGGLGSSIAMARLLSNGQIDSSFGDHGVVRLDPPGSSERIRRIALQPDGKIVSVGYSSTSSNHHQLTVLAFSMRFGQARSDLRNRRHRQILRRRGGKRGHDFSGRKDSCRRRERRF